MAKFVKVQNYTSGMLNLPVIIGIEITNPEGKNIAMARTIIDKAEGGKTITRYSTDLLKKFHI